MHLVRNNTIILIYLLWQKRILFKLALQIHFSFFIRQLYNNILFQEIHKFFPAAPFPLKRYLFSVLLCHANIRRIIVQLIRTFHKYSIINFFREILFYDSFQILQICFVLFIRSDFRIRNRRTSSQNI